MKIHIFYNFQDGPWGGGNQFLKALREAFRKRGIYSETLEGAEVVLVNSHHLTSVENLSYLIDVLSKQREKIIIHRIDGPVGKIRGKDDGADKLIFDFNKVFATGSIIQSKWCMENCARLGLDVKQTPYKTIFNAPNPDIFFSNSQAAQREGQKIRLIATSWSPNKRKGFDVYQWMDKHLDWQRYSMTFIGNSPVKFRNISHLNPLASRELGKCLREHDIFITASQNDPCSNSLIEALHTKRPALVLNDGGHPELVRGGGLTFDAPDEIPKKLSKLSDNLGDYRSKIAIPSLDEVTEQYIGFMKTCKRNGKKNIDVFAMNEFMSLYKKYTLLSRGCPFHIRVIKKVKKIFQIFK